MDINSTNNEEAINKIKKIIKWTKVAQYIINNLLHLKFIHVER